MLRILVQGRAVQLADDMALNLVIENPLMLADKIPTPYTTTFDIPPTPDNLKLFSFPNRVNSLNSFKEYTSEVFFGAIRLLSGVLVVQQFNKTIKAYFRGVVVPDTIAEQLYKIEMQKYTFGKGFWLYPLFDEPTNYAYKYKQLIFSSLTGAGDFVAAPIKIQDVEWPDAQNDSYFYSDNGVRAAQDLYFNFFNARRQEYMMYDTGVTTPLASHTLIFPEMFLYRIFDSIFGQSLEDNVFTRSELEKIVVTSAFHQAFVDSPIPIRFPGIISESDFDDQEVDKYFYLNSYMPAIAANDLFKDIFKIFCCTLFSVNGKFRILFNNDILSSYESEAWSGKLIGSLALSKQAAQFYQYGYANKTVGDPYYGFTLDTLADLYETAAATEDPTPYLITSINQVITKAKREKANPGDPDRYIYEVQRADFGRGPEPDTNSIVEPYDMSSGTAPLPVNLEYYWHEEQFVSGIEFNTWAVPVWDGDRLRRPDSANILLYQGLSNTFLPGDKYPLVTPYNVDHFGNKLGALTLDWSGEYGLLNRFHAKFKDWVESDRKRASGTFRLSALDIRNLDLSRKKHINGSLFLIEKVNVTIRKNSIEPAVVDFLEAPGGSPTTYISVHREDFARNNCGSGQSGSLVPFTKIYSSEVSQEAADALAVADEAAFQTEGQAWANAQGFCSASGDVVLTGDYSVIWFGVSPKYPRGRITFTLSGTLSAPITVDYSITIYQHTGSFSETITGSVNIPAGSVNAVAISAITSEAPGNPDAIRISGSVTRVVPNPVGGANVLF